MGRVARSRKRRLTRFAAARRGPWPAGRGGWKVGSLVALILAALGGYGLTATGVLAPELEHWREVWPVSWNLVTEHSLRGVGPAQLQHGLLHLLFEVRLVGGEVLNLLRIMDDVVNLEVVVLALDVVAHADEIADAQHLHLAALAVAVDRGEFHK